MKPTLDEWVQKHDEDCTREMMHLGDLSYCDCGQAERAAELAQLRASRDGWQNTAKTATARVMELSAALAEARKAIWYCWENDGDYSLLTKWYEAHPEPNDGPVIGC